MIHAAKKWIGYLEHQTNDLLGVYTANIGKGGYTIFAEIVKSYYRWREFSGLPWCAIFVHAVCLETLGKDKARSLLGKPHAGTRTLARRIERKGMIRNKDYIPKANDLVFLHNGDGKISHVGIVEGVDDDILISIEGNTVDPSGHFPKDYGGAVAQRRRKLTDDAIVCYAEINMKGWLT
jgi:hypothetical protein